MRIRTRQGCFVLALVTTVGLVAGSASAGDGIRTGVTIEATDDGAGQELLTGEVRSPKAKCERHRTVKLYWDPPGPPRNFRRVRTRRSDSEGQWVVVAPGPELPPGRYHVKVTKDDRGGDTCKKAKSRTITVNTVS
jgi:hypothetical protein